MYELAVLLHPDLEIDLPASINKIEKIVTDNGGNITAREEWGKRKLAYPVKHQGFAIYLFYQFDIAPDKITHLERALLISEEVLRHLVVALPEEALAAAESKPSEDKPAAKSEVIKEKE